MQRVRTQLSPPVPAPFFDLGHGDVVNSVLRALVVALLPFAVAACAGSASRNARLDPRKSEGVIVGSVTFESGRGEYGLLVQGKTSPDVLFGSVSRGAFGSKFDPLLQTRGGTFALVVPAGEYRIAGWRRVRGLEIAANAVPISIQFTVEQGKGAYVGNLHFDPHWENVQLLDMSERDFPVFRRRYEVLSKAPLELVLPKGFSAEDFGGGYVYRYAVPRTPGALASAGERSRMGSDWGPDATRAAIKDFFEVAPPTGDKWSMAVERPDSLLYVKELGSPDQTASALIRVMKKKPFKNGEDFLTFVRSTRINNTTPDRFKILSYEEVLDAARPALCTKHRLKAEDKAASRTAGASRFMESKGVTCMHPTEPLIVTVDYSERSGSTFSDPQSVKEGDDFVASLKLK